jgi:hypothetical protein
MLLIGGGLTPTPPTLRYGEPSISGQWIAELRTDGEDC